MKITRIRTTRLHDPDGGTFQDATMPMPGGRGLAWMFVELETNAGITGIAYSEGAGPVRAFIHEQLSDLVVGADPFETEKIWNDMFWRVRGNGRKGVAFHAISAIDIALWDIKAKALRSRCTGCSARRTSACRSTVPAAGRTTRRRSSFASSGFVERGFTRTKMKVGKDFGRAERRGRPPAGGGTQGAGRRRRRSTSTRTTATTRSRPSAWPSRSRTYDVGWFEEPVLADDIQGLAAVAAQHNDPGRDRRARVHEVRLQ